MYIYSCILYGITDVSFGNYKGEKGSTIVINLQELC